MTALRRQDGFTLPEMLVAITITMIVSLAAFSLIEFTMKRAGETAARVETTQRARLAMDTVVRQLRSQVCQTSGTPPMVDRTGNATDADNASFFVDFTDGTTTAAPQLHTIGYDAANRRLVERDYTANKPADPNVDPVYAATPTTTRVLLSDVIRDGTRPIFTYYPFGSATALAVPVVAPNLDDVARIVIRFKTLPSRGADDARGAVVLSDQVFVREVDPNAGAPNPSCE